MEGLDWLDSLPDFEADRSVRRLAPAELSRAAANIGLLDAGMRFIHVVGTNGKGTTAGLAGLVLAGLGYRTGVFRSPQLCDVTETIMVDARPVSRERLDEELIALARLEASGLLPPLTRFEVLVLAALSIFALEGCEMAVIEAGLGGRDDATNILDAEVVVVTSVGHDHLAQLGPTLADVLANKLGVVGPRAHVVSGRLDPALAVRAAELVGSERLAALDAMEVVRTPGVGGQVVRVRHFGHAHDVFLPAFGPAACDNLALALTAVELLLGADLPDDRLGPILMATRVVGCAEVVRRDPLVVVDTAHNPEAASNLHVTLEEAFGLDRAWGLMIGMTHGRDPDAFLEGLALPRVDAAMVLECGVDPSRIEAALHARYPGVALGRWPSEMSQDDAVAALGTDVVLATGSHRVCARLLCPGPVALVRE